MCDRQKTPNDIASGLLLFIGFSSSIVSLVMWHIGAPFFFTIPFAILAFLGLCWGFSRFGQSPKKGRLMICSMIPAIFLSPAAIAMPFVLFMLPQYVQHIVSGPNIVKSVTSPNQEYEAYVHDAPCLDPPNQSLYVQQKDVIHYMYIAQLAGDVDAIKEIHWSPDRDIVVFHTRYNLIAARVPGYQTVKIPLGREWTRTKPNKQSTFAAGGPKLQVAQIDFPQPGVFSYRLKNSDKFKAVDMNSI
ncbi:MAG: hypothetical protein ACYTBZ_11985 [Planctomycetota bacterium]|jgi:hypothetical protein